MSKIELDPITSGYNLSKINSNFQRLEEELNNKVLYRQIQDGEPNAMSENLDMNSNDILNVGNLQSGSITVTELTVGGVPVVAGGLVVDQYAATREALRRSYGESGFNLVLGSFDEGGTLVNTNDVLLDRLTGKAYSYSGALPRTVIGGAEDPLSNPLYIVRDIENRFIKTGSSVADLLLVNPLVGKFYRTEGYAYSGDGGGAEYKAFPVGTAADGISDHGAVNGVVFVLQPKEQGIDIRSCGATSGGDCTAAIAAAISKGSVFKCSVFVPAGVWISAPITVQDFTDIVGVCDEGGWARIAETGYTFRSVIKLKDGSNDTLIKVPSGRLMWSLRNLTLDGNKANQTSFGSHGIRCYQTSGLRNFGGNIAGVRSINSKGWGLYFEGGPLNLSNSFFMSGGLFVNASDVKASDVDFDGTDGLHCSLCIVQSNSLEAWSNILCYGWGEADQTKQVQEVVGSVDTSSVFTAPTGSFLYEGAPVSVPVNPGFVDTDKSAAEILFAHNVSGDLWELYTHPFGSGPGSKVLFSSVGAVTLRHGGTEAAMIVSRCARASFNGRVGGAKAQGAVIVKSNRHNMRVSMFNNNMRQLAGAAAVEYIGSTLSSIDSGSKLGEASARINYAVAYDATSSSNDIASDVVMRETTTGILVNDLSTADYAFRNRFNVRSRSNGVKEWVSANKDKEPGFQFMTGRVTTDTAVPVSTNTTVPLTALQSNGVTLASDTISLPVTEGGLYKVRFVIAATATPSAEILFRLTGLGANIAGGEVRSYSANRSGQIEVVFRATSTTTLGLSLVAFSASAFTISSSNGFSYFSVEKLGDSYVS